MKSRPWPSLSLLATVIGHSLSIRPICTIRALFVLISGKRIRAWNQLCVIAQARPNFHDFWTRHLAPGFAADWCSDAPPALVACLVFGGDLPPLALARTISSLRAGFGADVPIWTCGENAPGCSRLDEEVKGGGLQDGLRVIADVTGLPWLFACRSGDTVAPELGRALSTALAEAPDSRLIFWDEDVEIGKRRNAAWIKPEWDPLLHLSRDGLGGACALHMPTAVTVINHNTQLPAVPAGFSALALATAAASQTPPFRIPLLLCHRRNADGFADARAWRGIVMSVWPEGFEFALPGDNCCHLVVQPMAPTHWPAVSIIIPTRDRPELISACLKSLTRIEYPGEVEIIVVDNGSCDPVALACLATAEADGLIRIVRDDRPFNFSRLNNRAAAIAHGSLLCLLNNDVEALDGGWLGAMVRHAVQPHVGAVGAMLTYPDGSIQHAGVAIGMGNAAGHVQRGVVPTDPGHRAWYAVTRRVSAVTAACLVVRRDSYVAVGGLDEAGFAIAFNDVDFCLRLEAAGFHNVYCAQARLLHRESRTRGSDYVPAQFARFSAELALLQERWRTRTFADAHFSPQFSASSERCVLKL